MIRLSSDWHCNPDQLIPQAVKFITEGKRRGDILVGVGDLFNFIPIGRERFRGCKALNDFIGLLDGYLFYYITGNHDPYGWVRGMFSQYPNILVSRSVDFEVSGRTYRFFHGHQRSDWWVWRHIAPGWVEFAVDHFPALWYRICKWLGWLPGTFKTKIGPRPTTSERTKLDNMVWAIQAAWKRYAAKTDISVVIGHTHMAFYSHWWTPEGKFIEMVDGGNLRDSSSVVIDWNQAAIVWA